MSAAHHEIFAFLELDGGNLELLQALDEDNQPKPYTPPPIESPYCPHVALCTADMDALMADVKDRGIPVVNGPLEISGKVRWVYLSDPDQNVIEFIQWL
jgi:lactoylglutathione lyase